MGRQKIFLVQLFSNGDCLYATAVARQIKNDYPSSHLTWAIAGFCKNIIFNNPYVDEVKEVNDVPKSDVFAFRAFLKKIKREQREGIWDKVIITHNDDRNLALYDGTIRGMILRAYPGKMTVPLQPVLFLTEHEKQNAAHLAESHSLKNFKNVILWEFAPQSGQSVIAFDFV
ncbi:MAG: glycosyltransferase family 9 protein, partial [Chitinophagaceae bacterium]